MPNEVVARQLDVSAQWITKRAGIRERRRPGADETAAELAATAAADTLRAAGCAPQDVDLVLVATIPLALADSAGNGRLPDGARVLMAACGAAFAGAATVVEWGAGDRAAS